MALVDCDVHHTVKNRTTCYPYLPRVYRERVIDQGFLLPGSGYFNMPKRAGRTDLIAGCDASMDLQRGRQTNDDYEVLKEQHLDLWNVDIALLTGSTRLRRVDHPRPRLRRRALPRLQRLDARALGGARRPRFLLAIGVSTTDPKAVAEIERSATTRRSRRSCCRPATRGRTATATTTRSGRPARSTACRSSSTPATRAPAWPARRPASATRPTTSRRAWPARRWRWPTRPRSSARASSRSSRG